MESDKVTILFEAVDEVSKKAEKIMKKLEKLDKKSIKNKKEETKSVDKLNKAITLGKKGNINWYNSMLPLLFVTQQVSQSFKSMLQPANDLLDVQGTLNDFLAIAFLPTAEENLEAVINWGGSLIDLSDDTRRAYGENLRFAQVGSQVVSGIAEATLLGAGLGGQFGALAGAAGAVAGSYNVMTDKQSTMIASIQGPLNTAIGDAIISYGKERDAQIEVKNKLEELEKQGGDSNVLNAIANPGDVAFASWELALKKLKEYQAALTYSTSNTITNINDVGKSKYSDLLFKTDTKFPSKVTPSTIYPYTPDISKGAVGSERTMVNQYGSPALIAKYNSDTSKSGTANNINNNVVVNISATKIDPKLTWDAIQPQFRSDMTKYLSANTTSGG